MADWKEKCSIPLALLSLMMVAIIPNNFDTVFGSAVEIIEEDPDNLTDPRSRSAYYTNSLKIEWKTPDVESGYELVGYQILRKTIDTNYVVIVDNTKSKSTTYTDYVPQPDWYAYKVTKVIVPIGEEKPIFVPNRYDEDKSKDRTNRIIVEQVTQKKLDGQLELEKKIAEEKRGIKRSTTKENVKESITKHGIDRNHSLFAAYASGQELLAQEVFEELTNGKVKQFDSLDDPTTIFGKHINRAKDPVFQENIKKESAKAQKIFELLYDVKIKFAPGKP